MTIQAQMQATLAKVNIPSKDIHVYGSQIVITCWSHDAASKWASVVGKFAKVKTILEANESNADQAAASAKHPTVMRRNWTHKVWRMYATI